eukprot:489613_1
MVLIFENIIKQNSLKSKQDGKQMLFKLLLHFRHKSMTRKQFEKNMNKAMNVSSLPKKVKHYIKNIILKSDVETIHFKIKHGLDIHEFSNIVINAVDELVADNKQNKGNNFVKRIYELIATCFIVNIESSNDITLPLHKQKQWVCQNCTNNNFNKYIGGTMNSNISHCSLCGIKEIDSIIIKTRNYDTFAMVNVKQNTTQTNESDTKEKQEEDCSDLVIEKVVKNKSFDLKCPNSNDNKSCGSIYRLAKQLIIYNKWINTVHQKMGDIDDVDRTIQVDIKQFINNDQYKKVFAECAKSMEKINDNDVTLLIGMLNDNKDGIASVDKFLNLKRKKFAKCIQKNTGIKPAPVAKLYSIIEDNLKHKAQALQFGNFLTELNMDMIDSDYYHILQCHINEGNKITIQNVFDFFNIVVHYQDPSSDITDCISCKRRQKRLEVSKSAVNDEKKNEIKRRNTNVLEDKNIFSLKQYYMQCQLDTIHTFLVHSNWKHFLQPSKNKHDENINEELKFDERETVQQNIHINKSKYISNINIDKSYGFGVDHSYPNLKGEYCSLHDELSLNT